MAKIKRSVGPEYVSIVAFIFLRRSPHCQIVLQICVISLEHLILSSVPLHHLPPLLSQLMTLQLFLQTKLKQSVVSFHLHSHRTPNQLDPLLKLPSSPSVPSLRRKYPNFSSPANMSSRPNPLAPSPSYLSHTLTSTNTHYQHISPHRHLPHCIQAGSDNPTAQKTYIKHFSFRKLQTCLSPSIHSQNTRTSCLQPGLIVSFTEQQTGC